MTPSTCRQAHLDDVGAVVGKQRAAEVACHHLTQVQHLRSHNALSAFASAKAQTLDLIPNLKYHQHIRQISHL